MSGKESRTGGLKADLSASNSVSFSVPRAGGIGYVADMTLKGATWPVYDFGDTLPVIADDPANELYGKTSTDKNKCLLLHIAAVICWENRHGAPTDCSNLTSPQIIRKACAYRLEQLKQSLSCREALWEPTINDPWSWLN